MNVKAAAIFVHAVRAGATPTAPDADRRAAILQLLKLDAILFSELVE
jgi:hypothetical protein